MGQPGIVNLVELGQDRGPYPHGRSSVCKKGSSKFSNFTKALNIHMVDCSPVLQEVQYNALKCTDETTNDDNSSKRTITMCLAVQFHGIPLWNRFHQDGRNPRYDGLISDSLQAIRKHEFVEVLDDPGSANLSAHVDFESIRHSAKEVSAVCITFLP
ncbi:uncharacterized protein LOC122046223 isoform X3 [Zingiber officinale]|uniref:uncharacterized protein LOC122046223 isoform X3 n=1 Tax=Zingiber officinale TaxID=94328 RepID=UPI001C4CE6C6|nr:uncharacterized protein LOC122046223 isoform X3 [Zingiber officinale]XP_042462746.1 uncharacterized protein LOC122046223 isoform X3 [Zingiber officinale]XP_042462747.1 uncharacterized protein LOC122046223 isoform X3 [Zingiber officinale]XP_042462748.1 uncharacterized protein LOC122046223 isoform X3 [Zingiber officinale]